jgi:hypothetical protein
MNPTITISPHGGFGNRMRVMCAAYYYADKNECNLKHLWDGGIYSCPYPHIQLVHDRGFAYFFKEKEDSNEDAATENSICYSEWLPSVNGWWRHQNYGQQKLKCTTIYPSNTIPNKPESSFLIETTHRFMPMTSLESYTIYKKHFCPHDTFIRQISALLPPDIIGISIRRSEFLFFFSEANVGKDELYKWLKSFTQPVVLFSEDKVFLEDARKIINNLFLCEFENSPQETEDRAFLEFLTLSLCSHVYGTAKSSFAEEAALFGNVPYTAITKELIVLE